VLFRVPVISPGPTNQRLGRLKRKREGVRVGEGTGEYLAVRGQRSHEPIVDKANLKTKKILKREA